MTVLGFLIPRSSPSQEQIKLTGKWLVANGENLTTTIINIHH